MKHLSDNNFNSNKLENAPTPVSSGDAVNKAYADTKLPRADMRSIDRLSRGTGGFTVTLDAAIQGVAHDGTFYYVSTATTLYKYDDSGTLVLSRSNAGDGNTFKYLGDMVAVDGKLYVASANYKGPAPFSSYCVVFNTSDLTYVGEHQISNSDRCDSITYHDGYFWCPMYGKTVRQFDSSWNFVAEYPMPIGNWEVDPSANGIGFDGATWVGGYLVLNPHEGIYPECAFVLYFNGTSFERISQPSRPTYCTQGIDYIPSTGQIVAAERNTMNGPSRVTLMNIRTEIPSISEWKELRRATLENPSSTITVKDLPNRRYLKLVTSVVATGGTVNQAIRFNNDTAAKYVRMRSAQMVAGTASVSQTSIGVTSAKDDTQMITGEILNLVGSAKVGVFTSIQTDVVSAATEPTHIITAAKYADTSSYINRIDVINSAGTGNFAAGSELIVYGRG